MKLFKVSVKWIEIFKKEHGMLKIYSEKLTANEKMSRNLFYKYLHYQILVHSRKIFKELITDKLVLIGTLNQGCF